MSIKTDELLKEKGIRAEDCHLPAGGVAVFGLTGSGKSAMFFGSRLIDRVVIADTGSMSHLLWAKPFATIIDPAAELSPIDTVAKAVGENKNGITLIDSFTTLQEAQVAWYKKFRVPKPRTVVSLREHMEIVGNFRDLILFLARAQTFTVFNTSPGGRGKNPDGTEVVYPSGCITGYPSLNGTNANSETCLSRWGTVWGVFKGYKEIPRGLYVPGKDLRPESYASYAPLKDPCGVVTDNTTDGKQIWAFPDRSDKANVGRCVADELIVEMSARYPKSPSQSERRAETVSAGGITPAQLGELNTLIAEKGIKIPGFLAHFDIPTIDAMPLARYDEAVQILRGKTSPKK